LQTSAFSTLGAWVAPVMWYCVGGLRGQAVTVLGAVPPPFAVDTLHV
jgi:hypothetical protein